MLLVKTINFPMWICNSSLKRFYDICVYYHWFPMRFPGFVYFCKGFHGKRSVHVTRKCDLTACIDIRMCVLQTCRLCERVCLWLCPPPHGYWSVSSDLRMTRKIIWGVLSTEISGKRNCYWSSKGNGVIEWWKARGSEERKDNPMLEHLQNHCVNHSGREPILPSLKTEI